MTPEPEDIEVLDEEWWRDLHFDWRNCTCGTGCMACEYGAP